MCHKAFKAIEVHQQYEEWEREYFPTKAFWFAGLKNEAAWSAHAHWNDDSYSKEPA